jgi:hypothetical protein
MPDHIIQLFSVSRSRFLTRKRLRETAESALLQTGGHAPFARDGARTKKNPGLEVGWLRYGGRKFALAKGTDSPANSPAPARKPIQPVLSNEVHRDAAQRFFLGGANQSSTPCILMSIMPSTPTTEEMYSGAVPYMYSCTRPYPAVSYSCSCWEPEGVKHFSLYIFSRT